MNFFGAPRIHDSDDRITARFEFIGIDDLRAGEVVVRVRYSTINYKDALAATGSGRIPRRYPLVGGVGSLPIDMLCGRGYEVVAVSGKPAADDYLTALGAARVLRRSEINLGKRPLEAARWAGAIDKLGGEVLTWLTRTMDFFGNIASIGLAASPELHTTVMPFILRGVSLLGINSVANPRELRLKVWERIATDLRPRHLHRVCARSIPFDALPAAFPDYLAGPVQGRTLVRIS